MSEFFEPSHDFFEAWGEVPEHLEYMPGDVLIVSSADARDLSGRQQKLLQSDRVRTIIEFALITGRDVVLEAVGDVGTRLIIGKDLLELGWMNGDNRLAVIDHRLISSTPVMYIVEE